MGEFVEDVVKVVCINFLFWYVEIGFEFVEGLEIVFWNVVGNDVDGVDIVGFVD